MSVLSKRALKHPTLDLKSPQTASTIDPATASTLRTTKSSLIKSSSRTRLATTNSARKTFFFTSSVLTDHDEDIPGSSKDLSSIPGFSTSREHVAKNNGFKDSKKVQVLEKVGVTLPAMNPSGNNLNSIEAKEHHESERRLMTAPESNFTERSHFEYRKQEKYMNKNPHFFKFSNYVQAISKSESKNSFFNKETFYYPDQIEINQKLEEKTKRMQILEKNALYHMRSKNY